MRAANEEEEVYQFALSCLEPVLAPPMSFAEMKQLEAQRDCTFLGMIRGNEIWYLPNKTTPQAVNRVVQKIAPQQHDNEGIRLALYQLWLTTRHEKMPAEDRDDMLRIYVTNLCAYPVFAVRAVLSHFAANAVFFPAWAEINAELQQILGWRARLLSALRTYSLNRKAKG